MVCRDTPTYSIKVIALKNPERQERVSQNLARVNEEGFFFDLKLSMHDTIMVKLITILY